MANEWEQPDMSAQVRIGETMYLFSHAVPDLSGRDESARDKALILTLLEFWTDEIRKQGND